LNDPAPRTIIYKFGASHNKGELKAVEQEPKRSESSNQRAEIMGYARPMNALWLALLFLVTWALWSLRAALILLGLMIVLTILGIVFRRSPP
jgi:hypothetical protein